MYNPILSELSRISQQAQMSRENSDKDIKNNLRMAERLSRMSSLDGVLLHYFQHGMSP